MKNIFLILSFLFMSTCGFSPSEEYQPLGSACPNLVDNTQCTVIYNLNLRSAPIIANNIILSIPQNSTVNYLNESQHDGTRCWAKVDFGARSGWTATEFLSCGGVASVDKNPKDPGVLPAPSHILYPGDKACEEKGCELPWMSHPEIEIPAKNGIPWGNTYLIGADTQKNLAAYSSGRIALLRRLGLRNNGEWAILIDPSYEDNARDFLGTGSVTGDSIVKTWLLNSPDRHFLLVYSTWSGGWKRYAKLKDDKEVGSRVKVCQISIVHKEIPKALGPQVVLDPAGFSTGTCS